MVALSSRLAGCSPYLPSEYPTTLMHGMHEIRKGRFRTRAQRDTGARQHLESLDDVSIGHAG
jgi:hypothetical protein